MTNQSLDRVPSLEEGQEGRQQARTLSWSKAQALRPFAERATVSFAHLFSTLVVGWFTAHFRDSLLGRVRFATRVCSGHLDSAGLGSLWGWSRLLPKPRTVRYTCLTTSDHSDRVPRRDRVGSGRCCALVPSPAVPEMHWRPGPERGHATRGAMSFLSAHCVETGPWSPCSPRGCCTLSSEPASLWPGKVGQPPPHGLCKPADAGRLWALCLWSAARIAPAVADGFPDPPHTLLCPAPPHPGRDGVMSPPWGWARCALSASLSGSLSLCLSRPRWTHGVSLGPQEPLQDSLNVLLACCVFERVPAL